MHIVVNYGELKDALTLVKRAVAGKSSLPVLEYTKLAATEDGTVTLAGTNLSIAMTVTLPTARVDAPGAICLPARSLLDTVSNAKAKKTAEVRIGMADATTANLAIGALAMTVKGMEAEEFPVFASAPDEAPAVVFPATALREAIEAVAPAAATDDTRPVLSGIKMHVGGGRATLDTADGFRLARATFAMDTPPDQTLAFLPRAYAMAELALLLKREEKRDRSATVQLFVNALNDAIFRVGGVTLVSRQIDGEFPDVERVIPAQHTTRAIVNRSALLDTLGAVRVVAKQSANITRITVTDGGVAVKAAADGMGEAAATVAAMVHGEQPVTISLNIDFTIAAAKLITSDDVAIELQTSSHAAVFKPVGVEGYVHIVMPMTIR